MRFFYIIWWTQKYSVKNFMKIYEKYFQFKHLRYLVIEIFLFLSKMFVLSNDII